MSFWSIIRNKKNKNYFLVFERSEKCFLLWKHFLGSRIVPMFSHNLSCKDRSFDLDGTLFGEFFEIYTLFF